MLCEAGADVNHTCHEQTPLHASITRSDPDIEIVRVLLNHGGDVNKFVEERGTPVRFFPLQASQKNSESMGREGHPTKYKVVSNITKAIYCY